MNIEARTDQSRHPLLKPALAIFALLAPLSGGSLSAQGQQSIGDFGLIDQHGLFHQLSKYGHKKAVVIIVQANGCDLIASQLPRFKALRQKWEPQGVVFLMMNSSDSRDDVRQEATIYDLDFPILLDHTQLVSESLRVSTAAQVLVMDPTNMTLVYRGPLGSGARRRRAAEPNPRTLTAALTRIVAGEAESMDTVVVEASGDTPNLFNHTRCDHASMQAEPGEMDRPDYATDVAPILQANCVACHQEGGIGPFAMDSYRQVRGWSSMMRETLMTKRMPPAQVDPAIGHFTNARYLADEDLRTLVHWIDQGAPRRGGEDPLLATAVPAKDADWELGEPDFIAVIPPQEVPATGVLPYRNVNVDLPFEEDKWVRAVQFRPGEKAVLHHLLSYVIPPAYDSAADGTARTQRRFLEGYAPGKTEAQVYPENAGVFIPKGYRLRMSLHYTPYGKPVVDNTVVGLYFHDTPPDHEFHNKSVTQSQLAIPAGAREAKHSQQFVFDQAIVLWGMRPHMHYRGKYFKFKVIYPDNTTEDLLSVPNYNFAWQPTYRMAEPRVLPAGSRVVVTGAFDNSKYNPGNPDPTKDITWGSQSWDEMFIGYFAYHNLEKDNNSRK